LSARPSIDSPARSHTPPDVCPTSRPHTITPLPRAHSPTGAASIADGVAAMKVSAPVPPRPPAAAPAAPAAPPPAPKPKPPPPPEPEPEPEEEIDEAARAEELKRIAADLAKEDGR